MRFITPKIFLMSKNSTHSCFFMMFISVSAIAQDSTLHPSFTFSFYADAFIAYYTDSVGLDEYQKFPSISPRSSQFGLNVALFSAKYTSEKVRSTITLHYGDVPRSTWSTTFNFIQEANAGVRLCKNFWLDAGFFRTHVGTEGLFPKENITSSVAIPTYFEPYYEAGLKLSYAPTEKFALNLYVLNGYNLFEDNNKKKSLGLLATYAINDHLSVGYDNYIGDESPDEDTINHLRFYNNVFLNFEKNKIKIVTGGDVCFQQNAANAGTELTGTVVSGLLAIRIMVANHFDVYGRIEGYYDPDGILSGLIVAKGLSSGSGLKLWGATLGIEYKPTDNSYVRLEGRDLSTTDSGQKIFYWNNKYTNSRFEALLNIGVWFP